MAKGNKPGHRRFGNIRTLPSGRYQASYLGPDGRRRYARNTFARKSDADRFLALTEGKILRGEWTDPERARVKLGDYVRTWIDQHPGLRPRTVELYNRLLRKQIAPHLGAMAVGDITTAVVREWRATQLTDGVSASQTAKAYRLLRAVLSTAVSDDLIPRNPCRIRGAGDEKPDERPVLSLPQVFELADLVGRHPKGNVRQVAASRYRVRYRTPDGAAHRLAEEFATRREAERALWRLTLDGTAAFTNDRRFRALVLLATFASLRWGEAIALRRSDLDTKQGTVTVARQFLQMDGGHVQIGPPKSRAGKRSVAVPTAILPAVREHLDQYAEPRPDALVFTGPKGGVLRRNNFRRATRWAEAVEALGVPGLHFHDLRHTGNMFAARSKASLRDLMDRMGHDSVRAALIYQHATAEADRAIAEAMHLQIEKEHGDREPRRADDEGDDGATGTVGSVA